MPLNDAILTIGAQAMCDAITHVSLHTAEPDGAGSDETTAGRQAASWDVAANGDMTLTTDEAFSGGTPGGPATYLGFWSASTGGTYYGHLPLVGATAFSSNGAYVLDAITITQQSGVAPSTGVATGTHEWDGEATGASAAATGSATGTHTWTGTATGYSDPPAWPTAETTGSSGTLTTTSIGAFDDNMTYENLRITSASGGNAIYGDNLTFTNCELQGGMGFRGQTVGVTLTDCTLIGGGWVSSADNITFIRCKVENFAGDAFHVTADSPAGNTCNNITLDSCYVSNATPNVGDHADGIQIRGSDNVHIENCWFHMGTVFDDRVNACVYFEEDNGGNTNYHVENNYFSANGYWVCYFSGGQGTVINNFFEPYFPGTTGYTYNETFGPSVTHSGNVDYNTGDPIPAEA